MNEHARTRSVHQRFWSLPLALSLAIALCFSAGVAQAETKEGDEILGKWLTPTGHAVIEITREGDEYVGSIVWLKDPLDDDGKPVRDVNNSNRRQRDRAILGLRLLRGFTFDGNRYVGGRVYDPDNGNDYRGRMSLDDPNTLSLRGYVGIAAFGRTEIWTRQVEDE